MEGDNVFSILYACMVLWHLKVGRMGSNNLCLIGSNDKYIGIDIFRLLERSIQY